MPATHLTLGECAFLACVLEASARKPGNVHRYRDFPDLSYVDFIMSAGAIAPVMNRVAKLGVGQAVLKAIRQTRKLVSTNTNLGIVLLLAPLAAVPRRQLLSAGIGAVLDRLTVADARAVYQAIRLAQPGGLGTVQEQDVAKEPTQSLQEAMKLAAGRDLVARQYANGFQEVLQQGMGWLQECLANLNTEEAIQCCHLFLLSEFPDTLIARKRGWKEAREASRRAADVLAAGWRTKKGRQAFRDLDAWLCAEGHQRNPGTTADLVTACLFAVLREGRMKWDSELEMCLQFRK